MTKTVGVTWEEFVRLKDERIAELEAAMVLIEQKATAAADYFDGSGEMVVLNFAEGTRDTARKALGKF